MTVRVGYFPNNNSLFVLRHRGILERSIEVEWVDLRSLPASPEPDPRTALPTLHSDWLFTDGGYDFIGTGFTPPITGLAHGRDLVYVGVSGSRTENGRLVVKQDSPIHTVADLAGKRVGIAHGSWQTTLLLFALDSVGLTWSDIEPVNTSVTDGAGLFRRDEIDAWVGAYPGLSGVERDLQIRTLIDTEGLFSHPSLWFTRRDFAHEHPNELAAIVAALRESDQWIAENPRAAAEYFTADTVERGGDASLDAWESALANRPFGIGPVTEEFLNEQQRAADLLFANKLLPKTISVRDAVLSAGSGVPVA